MKKEVYIRWQGINSREQGKPYLAKVTIEGNQFKYQYLPCVEKRMGNKVRCIFEGYMTVGTILKGIDRYYEVTEVGLKIITLSEVFKAFGIK